MNNVKLWKIIIFLALLVWLGIFMAKKIDLMTADLGRHLENGKWILENHFNLSEKNSPIHENFYSYTNSDFPVVNHHWVSGVLFYLIFKLSGFTGLSLFYVILTLVIFAIFFQIAKRNSDFTTATLLSLLLIPLIAERTEIRPEVFSYFFSGVFFWALWKWQKGELAASRLYVLPVFMTFWINLHVYFFIGFFLIGVFWLSETGKLIFSKLSDEEFLRKMSGAKNLTIVLFLSVLSSLLNPFGFKGLIYPLRIFENYGYTIVENKSVSFVENYGIINSNFLLIKVVLVFLFFSFVLVYFANRRKITLIYFLPGLFFGILGWWAIRNFTLLGLFALPILAWNLGRIFSLDEKDRSSVKENGLAVLYIFICIFAAFSSWQSLAYHSGNRGFGLLPENEKSAEFFRRENIKGPLFNNYDSGGYLTWELLSYQEKVFVDNRPAEYPSSFFSDVYKPMQDDPAIFERIDKEYNFNAVFFSRNDITPWGMSFLKKIKENPKWAKVFEDNYAIIYLKRNEANSEIIDKYKM